MPKQRVAVAAICCLLTAPVDSVQGSLSTPLASLLVHPRSLLTRGAVDSVDAQASDCELRLQQCWTDKRACIDNYEQLRERSRRVACVPSYLELHGGLPRRLPPGGKAEVPLLDFPAPRRLENWLANYAWKLHEILAQGLSPSDLEQYDQQENGYCGADAENALYCRMAYRALAIENWVQAVVRR